MKSNDVLSFDLGAVKTDTFSRVYPEINRFILSKDKQNSRNGAVKEILNFKTQITNPYNRCVGGWKRNINPFFLLAEAAWIFTGQKDVGFLKKFNSNISYFSDDGYVFHAPYGYRLRHWGIRSEDIYTEENIHASQGYDQIEEIITILSKNKDSRQAVVSIWNPDLDLNAKSKDIPCNDMIMFKIRDGKLHTTIQNRSNDLHWGLPTNIFQFSFLSECIASCLDIELGTQTHNSQSLHIYDWSDIAVKMNEEYYKTGCDLYDVAFANKIDFNFKSKNPLNRLFEIDSALNIFIYSLDTGGINNDDLKYLKHFSSYLYKAFRLCEMFLTYKKCIKNETVEQINKYRYQYIKTIGDSGLDIDVLAQNFFAHRITNDYNHLYLGKL
jgi:thymidylate synthase